jgi:hypothetical protein
MKLAIHGVNSRVDHFATAAEQSQHIHEFVVAAAKLGADQFGMLAVFSQRFDGLRQGNRLVGSDRGALFGLGEAGIALGGVGSQGWRAKDNKQRDDNDKTGNRHREGVNGVPVNAT